jgi:hypothetical protein
MKALFEKQYILFDNRSAKAVVYLVIAVLIAYA